FGTGSTPVMPYYINVGGQSGVAGPFSADQLAQEAAKYNVDYGKGPIYQIVRAATGEGTDWYDAITRVAPLHRHSLGINGGSETSRFFVGMGIQDQAGILLNNSLRRISFRANSEFDVTKRIRVGENFQATYRRSLGVSGGNGGQGVSRDENSILGAFRMPSIIPIYDEFGGYAGTAASGFNNQRHPVAERDAIKGNTSCNE